MVSESLRPLAVASVVIMLASLPNAAVRGVARAPDERLTVVMPIASCDSLSATGRRTVDDKPAHIEAARSVDTAKGVFCKVTGVIEPAIRFEVDFAGSALDSALR